MNRSASVDCLGRCLDSSLGEEGRRYHDKAEDERSPEGVTEQEKENLMTTTLTPDTNQLREIALLPTESALPRAARFLSDLVKDRGFLQGEILPLLQKARKAQDWYVSHHYDGGDDSYSLKIFVWPSGTGTKIHDHSSWGAY